jgi:hypothetical protein
MSISETTARLTLEEIEINPLKFKPAGVDRGIRQKAMLKYLPAEDIQEALSDLKFEEVDISVDRAQKLKQIVKNPQHDALLYDRLKIFMRSYRVRAFGNEGTRPYIRDILEKVRVSQATAMHFWIIGVLSLSLGTLSYLHGKLRLLVLVIPILAGVWSSVSHESGAINAPIALLYTCLFIPIGLTARKWEFTGGYGRQFFVVSVLSFLVSLIATFAWSEYRATYFEAAIVLGSDLLQNSGIKGD